MNRCDNLMRQAVTDGVFPGGVLLVSAGSDVLWHEAYGTADLSTGEPVTPDTVFDLASLTKPLATTLAVMRLFEQGRLAPEITVGELLPDYHDTDKATVTVGQLLRHTSGLPDYRKYFETLQDIPHDRRRGALRKLLAAEPLVSPIGATTRYSDLGFMLLQDVVETVSRRLLDRFVSEAVSAPLALERLFFGGNARYPSFHYAATEDCPWRGRVIRGEVHDENAWVIGGVAGHAGLFGTAADVHRLVDELVTTWHGAPARGLFLPETVRLFFKRHTPDGRALGFDTPTADPPACGRRFSEETVGHLGFAGTSFWIDLPRRISVILLTNRVHPTRRNEKIREFRPVLHDAIMAALDSVDWLTG